MDKLLTVGKWFYALAFFVFGIQHFIYLQYVATLVPGWIPWHLFWAGFVAMAFMALAISLVINKYVWFSCIMLAVMLALFVFFIHIPNLLITPQNPQSWTRALQDLVIMGTALMLTGETKLQIAGRYFFAVPMIILGVQHFDHLDFVTAKVPAYLPAVTLWDYLVGGIIVIAAVAILTNRYGGAPALFLAVFLLVFALLYHLPPLIADVHNGQQWTGAMLDVAIIGGAFIAAALPAAYFKAIGIATQS